MEIVVGQEKFKEASLLLLNNIKLVSKEELLFQSLKILIVKMKKRLKELFQVYLKVVSLTLDLLMKFIKQVTHSDATIFFFCNFIPPYSKYLYRIFIFIPFFFSSFICIIKNDYS